MWSVTSEHVNVTFSVTVVETTIPQAHLPQSKTDEIEEELLNTTYDYIALFMSFIMFVVIVMRCIRHRDDSNQHNYSSKMSKIAAEATTRNFLTEDEYLLHCE